MPQSAQSVRFQLWQERLARFEAESITAKEFCRREGVSIPSFYQWKKKLGQTQATTVRRATSVPPAFASVRLTDSSTEVTPVLRLPGGASIELSEQVRRECLVDLLAACIQAAQTHNCQEAGR